MLKGRQTKRKLSKPYLEKAVVYMGGRQEVERLLNVSHSRLSNWLYSDIRVPAYFAQLIEEITEGKFKRNKLRPKEWVD